MHLHSFITRAGGLAVACWLTGCLHIDQHLCIQPDGSGRLSGRYTLPAAQWEALTRAASAATNAPRPPEGPALLHYEEETIRGEFRALTGAGLTLEEIAITAESNGARTVRVEVDFRDLAGLAQSEYFAGATLGIEPAGSGRYLFRQSPPLQFALAGDLAGERARVQAALDRRFAGFQARLRVTVPGTITTTSADQHEAATATWTFAAADAAAMDRARRNALTIEFQGAGLEALTPPSAAAKPAGTDHGGG